MQAGIAVQARLEMSLEIPEQAQLPVEELQRGEEVQPAPSAG